MDLEFLLDISVSLFLGMLIGLEREWHSHTAGLRTCILVCVGSTLFVSVARLVNQDADTSRIAAQVVSGMGFLGGGVIFREGVNVRGINTAATLWCCGAIGALSGSGLWVQSIFGTGMILVVNIFLPPVTRWIDRHRPIPMDFESNYRLQLICTREQEPKFRELVLTQFGEKHRPMIQKFVTEASDTQNAQISVQVHTFTNRDRLLESIVSEIRKDPEVQKISWERLDKT